MEEIWQYIDEFPKYMISSHGRVVNDASGKMMSTYYNRQGIVIVGLWDNPIQHTRSVARLVALAFLPKTEFDNFNTPIQLDGDRDNCHVENLAWRPRWFAYDYRAQFTRPPMGFGPIECIETGEEFETTYLAALRFGLLEREIINRLVDHRPVWPLKYSFKFSTYYPGE
jgi:hypothetical protein